MSRLNFDSNNIDEVKQYFQVRAMQLRGEGFLLMNLREIEDVGVLALFQRGEEDFQSLYVYEKERGQGKYKKNLVKNIPVLTTKDCGIHKFLKKQNITYSLNGKIFESKEYSLIKEYYGDGKAKRSNVYFMNHIDEGIAILQKIGASKKAMRAFMVHPLYQTELEKYYLENLKINRKVLILAMEYRNIANAYLSKRKIKKINEIKLSPLKDVNDMLIADKIQNYKDFCLYHKDTHERSKELDKYFKNWFKRLGIDKEYKELISIIS